ncbi:AI-2E family transporter [Porticoccaceae bacterium LTM1]|nr:AI-2E family transporter [Porticoccaceae bacterium LTM1]
MKQVFDNWINRYFGDKEAVLLALMLIAALVMVLTMGQVLAPLVTAIIIAFLLQGAVDGLHRFHIPRLISVVTVFTFFIGLLMAVLFFLVPLVIRQGTNLLGEVPGMVTQWQTALQALPEKYPQLISEQQISTFMNYASAQIAHGAEDLLKSSLGKVPNLMAVVVYLVMVPLMVFFLLKDRDQLHRMVGEMLPEQRPVMRRIWAEMNDQISNYVRGKTTEIVIVGVVTYVAFLILGVNYAALLGLMVGLSVVIPYIGAALVTVPVAMVAYFQWGWGGEFFMLMGVYTLIQLLDGNVLVPLLFSEAVNLHPVAIILAVLVFGSFWGFWGVFFAIPLATLVKAVYNAWPRTDRQEEAKS